MDAAKVHAFMKQLNSRNTTYPPRAQQEDRRLLEQIRGAKLLDRVDVRVLTLRDEIGQPPGWEPYQGVNDYDANGQGGLVLYIGGEDADGDWSVVKQVVWPQGRWLKIETSLTSVPNPYYIDPDVPDGE